MKQWISQWEIIARVIFKKTALYERELLLAANEEKEQESSCKWEQKANLFALCRVQPRLHKVNVWALGKQRCMVNVHSELLRSRICRVKTTTAKKKRPERKALFESRISVPAFCCAKLLSFALCASKLSPAHLLTVLGSFAWRKNIKETQLIERIAAK